MSHSQTSRSTSSVAAVRARAEKAVFTGLLALPERVQRLLAGRPVVRDGQTLATETQLTLKLQKDLVLDTYLTSTWGTDLPYAANQKFVTDYRKKYNETPAFYGAQSYDAANLVASAVTATKGNLKDKKAVGAALKAAKFDSVRGPFKFGNNNFPIQNVYQQEAYKVSETEYDLRTVSTVLTAHQDPHAAKCKM